MSPKNSEVKRPETQLAVMPGQLAGLAKRVTEGRAAAPDLRQTKGGPVMTTAAIYGRKSTDDERSADDGRSVDRQVALAREFAARQGWAVAEPWVITEEASGADFTRAGLVRLLAGARQRPRPFDVLVVMAVDRLGREQVRTAAVVQALHEAGVGIFTYQDGREVSFETPVE